MLFIFVVFGLIIFFAFGDEKDNKDKEVEIGNKQQIDEYLKTVWFVDDYKENEVYENMSFVILEQDGDRIKGKFTLNDVLYPNNHLYFTGEGTKYEETYAGEFYGKLDAGEAVCTVTWDYYGIDGKMKLKFIDRKKIIAQIFFKEEKCRLGKLTSGEYIFTTLDLDHQNNSDFKYADTIKSIKLGKWGDVRLVSRVRSGGKHKVLYLYLIDNFDNIIYDFSSEYPFPYRTKVNESKFVDINGDGLEDLIILIGSIEEKDEESDNQVRIFFQNSNGGFEESKQLFDILNSLSKKRRSNISYILNYVTDSYGNVVQLTDESGKVTNTYEYDSFGNELLEGYNSSKNDDNPWRFDSQYFDAEMQTCYMINRQYNLKIGRFTQEDPIRYEDNSGNYYIYASNDPINYHDPDGLKVVKKIGNRKWCWLWDKKSYKKVGRTINFSKNSSPNRKRGWNSCESPDKYNSIDPFAGPDVIKAFKTGQYGLQITKNDHRYAVAVGPVVLSKKFSDYNKKTSDKKHLAKILLAILLAMH